MDHGHPLSNALFSNSRLKRGDEMSTETVRTKPFLNCVVHQVENIGVIRPHAGVWWCDGDVDVVGVVVRAYLPFTVALLTVGERSSNWKRLQDSIAKSIQPVSALAEFHFLYKHHINHHFSLSTDSSCFLYCLVLPITYSTTQHFVQLTNYGGRQPFILPFFPLSSHQTLETLCSPSSCNYASITLSLFYRFTAIAGKRQKPHKGWMQFNFWILSNSSKREFSRE